jgi:hypothetical protein
MWSYKRISPAAALAILLFPVIAFAQVPTNLQHPEPTLSISDLRANENRILGEITNNSENQARDISLMVQNTWRWNDGYNPKIETPINAVLFKLQKELSPGETATFSYVVPLPESDRSQGSFVIDVSIAGFKLVPPQESSRLSSGY